MSFWCFFIIICACAYIVIGGLYLFSGVLFPLVFLSCGCTQKTLIFASSEAFLMLFGLDYVNSRLSNFSGPCYAVKKATLQHDFKNEGKL